MRHRKGHTMAQLTTNSATAWSPDVQAFKAADVIPDALILRGATVVTQSLEGDGPAARVPWVDDASATFTAEGADIDAADPTLSEVVVATAKVTQLLKVSREQWSQNQAAGLLSTSVARAVTRRANEAFIAQVAPVSPAITPPAGVANVSGIIEPSTAITANLDPLADAIAQIEANGGQPDLIVADPLAWGALRNLKTADSANSTLLGAGTEDQAKRLLGIDVATSPAVPVGKIVVLDSTATAAAVGQIQVAHSEHLYFDSDSIALRCTWRLGWGVQHPNRLAVVTVDGVTGEGEGEGESE